MPALALARLVPLIDPDRDQTERGPLLDATPSPPDLSCAGSDILRQMLLEKSGGTRTMAQTALARILVGPYGLHAFLGVMLALFVAFLWVFNFTTFF